MILSIPQRYYSLNQKKKNKIELMRLINRYIDPDDRLFLNRYGDYEENILFDSTSRNLLEDYSLESLVDIINPVEPWFTFNIKRDADDNVNDEELKKWASESIDLFFTFINESSYYKKLIADKRNYDIHGFSGMSFYIENNKLRISTENVFALVYNDNEYSDEINEVYWIKEFDKYTLEETFGYNFKEGTSVSKFLVLCACVPNTPFYIGDNNQDNNQDDNQKHKKNLNNNKKFVQAFFLLSRVPEFMNNQYYQYKNNEDYFGANFNKNAVEIGERIYLDDILTIVTVDFEESGSNYGRGLGKRLIIPSQNLNQLRKGLLKLSAYYENPMAQIPTDIIGDVLKIAPGHTYPHSYSGQKIEFLAPQGDYGAQVNLLQHEDAQARESMPNKVGPGPQKRSRQSQFEISQQILEQSKRSLIFKINYLKDGVSEHLKRMFKIAVKLKKIKSPPRGIKIENVIPSLASILLKEYKKQKAQSYVQALNLAQGYVALKPEAIDNINEDKIIRNIYSAMGVFDVIESEDTVESIRKQREEARQRQIDLEQQKLEAERFSLGAKSSKDVALGEQARAKALSQET